MSVELHNLLAYCGRIKMCSNKRNVPDFNAICVGMTTRNVRTIGLLLMECTLTGIILDGTFFMCLDYPVG